MITITKDMEEFEGIRFAIKATNKKDATRLVLSRVNFREWGVEATDGHRVHRAQFVHTHELGTYEIIKNTKSVIVLEPNNDNLYPDTDKVWPKDKELVSLPSVGTQGKNFSALATIIRALPKDSAINSDYLFDILDSETWSWYCTDVKELPVIFKNGTRSALLMLTKV